MSEYEPLTDAEFSSIDANITTHGAPHRVDGEAYRRAILTIAALKAERLAIAADATEWKARAMQAGWDCGEHGSSARACEPACDEMRRLRTELEALKSRRCGTCTWDG